MGWLLTMLTRPLGLVAAGVMIAVLGAWWLKTGYDDVPRRETLNRVEGVLERIIRPQRGDSSSNPPYVFEVKAANGATVQVTVPSWIVDEPTLRELRRGEAFSALMTEGGELWELSIGARMLLEYDARRATVLRAKETIRYWGPFVIVGGIVVAILGVLWRRNEKSGYFSQFLAAALYLSIFGFFGWVVWTKGMEYAELRRVLSNGADAQGLIIGTDSSGRGDYWLKVAWRDASGAELINNRVAVTKTFLDKLVGQKTATGIQLGIKYLVENGKPLAVAVEDAADLESSRRIELLFFAGLLCGGFLLFGRSTWRAWRRWRTTPGAGL